MSIIRPMNQQAALARTFVEGYKEGAKAQLDSLKSYLADTSVIATVARDVKNGDSFKKTITDASYPLNSAYKIPRTIKYIGETLTNAPIVTATEAVKAKTNELNVAA